ncbi:MAG: sugar phosphate isomerase/epimerase [Verrucomicrobia bacterium]|jgi:D-psicose/D-tagatose/L-ribulose 3-epimerase|nr:sugar phosphate isomerase/epimerase [Verrucomicrobiota bacterium]
MRIGLNMMLWTTQVTEEHFPLFDKLKGVGYDGVEIPILQGNLEPAHHEKVAQALRDSGLECSSSTAMPGPEYNAISGEASERANAIAFMKRAIDCSKAVGSDMLIGPFYQPLGQFSGVGPTADEQALGVESMRAMAEHAEGQGVTLAVEFLNRFECYFLNTLGAASALVKAVDNPCFGAMFDTFHANIEEKDPAVAIASYGDVIRHVHISENDRGTPGLGHVAFPDIFAALKARGYDGWYTIEAFGQALPDLAAAARIWRACFESPEALYEKGFELISSLA